MSILLITTFFFQRFEPWMRYRGENTVEPDRPQTTINCGAGVLRAGKSRLQTHTLGTFKPYMFCTVTMVA